MKEFSVKAHKPTVAVIDGNDEHRKKMTGALSRFFEIKGYNDNNQALEGFVGTPPEVIIIDEWVAPKGGIDLLRTIRGTENLSHIPVICTSAMNNPNFFPMARGLGVNLTLEKPIHFNDLLAAVSGQVSKIAEGAWDDIEPIQQSALKKTVSVFNNISDFIDEGKPLPYGEIKESCEPLVTAVTNNQYKDMLHSVRGHDNYSYVHSLRVATFLSLFGHSIGIKGDDLMTLSTGGLVHDIGKMAIPYDVLNKPGKLKGDEWDVMKNHVNITLQNMENSPDIPKGVVTIAAQHHEKLDGSGYPNRLSHGQLNDLARMATIVDVFGALTDRRVYKDPMPPEKALTLMKDEMSGELDQKLLALFREMLLDAATDVGMA